MSLEEKRDKLISDLQFFEDPQDRLAYVIDRAKKYEPLPDEFKIDDYKVEGCLSNLWFVPEFTKGKCRFRSDGDSMIVKGIAGLLTTFYSGESPEDILKVDPSFLAKAGITQHLSQNRKNGLGRVWQKIQSFAAGQIEDSGGLGDDYASIQDQIDGMTKLLLNLCRITHFQM